MRIVMDDTGDLAPELVTKYNIKRIPINVHFGTDEYLTNETIDHDAFYARASNVDAASFPKTSQPTPYQFVQVYESLIAEGEQDILTITVSRALSGTYESAHLAAEELAGKANFHLFDSQFGSAAQGLLALEAARLAADGEPAAAIVAHLEKMRDEIVIYLMIDNLEYAVKGGRVSALRSAMASLLNIKPVMQMKGGLIVEAAKVRTRNKAINSLVDRVAAEVGDRPVQLVAMHARAESAGRKLLEKAAARLNAADTMLVDLSIPVAINLGPGAIGLAAVPVQ